MQWISRVSSVSIPSSRRNRSMSALALSAVFACVLVWRKTWSRGSSFSAAADERVHLVHVGGVDVADAQIERLAGQADEPLLTEFALFPPADGAGTDAEHGGLDPGGSQRDLVRPLLGLGRSHGDRLICQSESPPECRRTHCQGSARQELATSDGPHVELLRLRMVAASRGRCCRRCLGMSGTNRDVPADLPAVVKHRQMPRGYLNRSGRVFHLAANGNTTVFRAVYDVGTGRK